MSAKYGLYAYGLVGKGFEQLDILGIDKTSKVYPVVEGDICVIVSEVDIDQFQDQIKNLISELTKNAGDIQNSAGDILQSHEQVIDALMENTTVVPLKFGTILKDEQAALKMLQDHEENFKSLLVKFRGKAEWGVKAYADKQVLIKYIIHNDQKIADFENRREKLSKGAAYLLGRKIEEEIEEHVVAQFAQVTEEILQELEQDASEVKLNNILSQKVTGKKKEMILNAAYLVEREKVDHFHQRGKSFIDKYEFMGLDLEFSGPWPPYNFT